MREPSPQGEAGEINLEEKILKLMAHRGGSLGKENSLKTMINAWLLVRMESC